MGRRFLRLVGLALIGGPLLYLMAAAVGAFVPRNIPTLPGEEPTIPVLLLAGPIHYDLLLPLNETTRERFEFARPSVPELDHRNARWVIFGWGSRAFYTSTSTYWDLRPSTIWKAATGDRAVARIDVAGQLPANLEVQELILSPTAYKALLDALLRGITPQPLPDIGLSKRDAFFPAEDRFNLFHTCNQWLGARLAEAGITTGRFTPTTWSLRWSLTQS